MGQSQSLIWRDLSMSFSAFYRLLMITLISAFLAFPQTGRCTVTQATLFPQSAFVEELVELSLQPQPDGRFLGTIILPPQADPDTFRTDLRHSKNVRIDNIAIRRVKSVEEDRISALRSEIQTLMNRRNDLQSKILSIEGELQLWQSQTKAKAGNVANTDLLSKAVGKNIHRLHREKFQTTSDVEELDERIRELQNRLEEATGNKETAWEVSLLCSGNLQKTWNVRFSYILGASGWKPHYRIEAFPAENRVRFEWEADIWQSSGKDWLNADIHLATHRIPLSLDPPGLPPWIIRPRQVRTMKKSLSMDSTLQASVHSERLVETAEIVERPLFSYSSWSIGKKSLSAGASLRVPVKTETWPCEYLYLARPSATPQVFVQATVKFANNVDIPPGQASFLIDNALAGTQSFSLSGNETILFFGPTPFITVSAEMIDDQSGAGNIFQNRQTRRWHRRIEAKNQSRSAAVLRIEEPAAQSRDERIRLTTRQSPEVSEKDTGTWVWILRIPSGHQARIDSVLEVEAPGEMELDFGLFH